MTPLALLAAVLGPFLGAQEKDDPEQELRSFQVAPGYEVQLFASEKEGVVKPLQIRFDAEGRLWVSCGASYPQLKPGEEPDDTIVVLEDTVGDGRAHTSRVWARGLSMPMGIEFGRGGLYVGSGTELLHLEDSTGSGCADRRTVLLRGFFTGDSHQNINSFVWSPGGELFFCQGLHAFSHVETPWGVERLDKAGVWRLRPGTLHLDPFLGNDMGPQNPYGVVFDDWGQPIMVAGNGQGIYYLVPAMIRTRHFLPYAQIWDRTQKLAGVDLLESRHLPADVQGTLVAGGFLNNAVYWFRIEEDGSGFRAKSLPPLIVSSHPSFRIVDVRTGPDGAIYLADWYNPIIGHYQASFRHPDRDKSHGRIWRVTAKGGARVKPPALGPMSIRELLEQGKSPERWVRSQAARLLAEKPRDPVTAELSRWVSGLDPSDPQFERLLLGALALYETLDVVEPALLGRLLRAKDYRARAYATRLIQRWQGRLENPLGLLAERAADPHPRVRLEAVVAASYVPRAESVEVASIAVDQPMDRFLVYALIQTVHALKEHWRPAFDAGRLAFGNRTERVLFVMKADGSPDVLLPLRSQLRSGTLGEGERANALLLVAAIGGPEDLGLVLGERGPRAARLAEELASSYRLRQVIPRGDLGEALRAWITGDDLELRKGALVLGGLWKVEPLRPLIERASRDASRGDVAQAALEALADLGTEASYRFLLERSGEGTLAERARAVGALARLDPKKAGAPAARLLGEPGAGSVALATVGALLSREGASQALAEALPHSPVSPDVAKLGLRAMSGAGRQDEALRAALSRAAGISSASPEYRRELVEELSREALGDGNPSRGEEVFRGALTNCFSCHAIGGAGGRVGPDLSAVGTGLPVDLVVESVLWPNRQVKEGYHTTAVILRNDQIVQGFRVSEDKEFLVLRDPERDALVRLPQSEIRARKEIGSVMPEGLTSSLTREELRDLIRFLVELGKPGPFRVPDAACVRRWRVKEGTSGASSSPEGGSVRFGTVRGELPLEELAWEGTPPVAHASFRLEVLREGRFRVGLGSGRGLRLALDGGAEMDPVPEALDLGRGRHEILLRIDRETRGKEPLYCQPEPAAGSSGELRIPNDP
jgi:putative heme-binding domain-containing protein